MGVDIVAHDEHAATGSSYVSLALGVPLAGRARELQNARQIVGVMIARFGAALGTISDNENDISACLDGAVLAAPTRVQITGWTNGVCENKRAMMLPVKVDAVTELKQRHKNRRRAVDRTGALCLTWGVSHANRRKNSLCRLRNGKRRVLDASAKRVGGVVLVCA